MDHYASFTHKAPELPHQTKPAELIEVDSRFVDPVSYEHDNRYTAEPTVNTVKFTSEGHIFTHGPQMYGRANFGAYIKNAVTGSDAAHPPTLVNF